MRDAAIFTYCDPKGRPRLRKIRRVAYPERKRKYTFQAARYTPKGVVWEGAEGVVEHYQPEFAAQALYNLPLLLPALRQGKTIYLPEGERDCDTGTSLFLKPFTTNWQGADGFNPEQAEWFKWYGAKSKVAILLDNDDAGHSAGLLKYKRLRAAGIRTTFRRPPEPYNDLTEMALGGLGLSALLRVGPAEVRERASQYDTARRASGETVAWRYYQRG